MVPGLQRDMRIEGLKDSFLTMLGGKRINISHPFSNMIGLSQRCIIVAEFGGNIVINEGVAMSGRTIYSMASIAIGRNTDIGGGCKIIYNDFHPLHYSQLYPKEQLDKVKKLPIVIGEGCLLEANSIILKGTTLGKNVVVGAGSVVCGNFPDNVIIAGNPARIVKENEELESLFIAMSRESPNVQLNNDACTLLSDTYLNI